MTDPLLLVYSALIGYVLGMSIIAALVLANLMPTGGYGLAAGACIATAGMALGILTYLAALMIAERRKGESA